ncbi:MAG: COR domain-containing protein [Chloroflexota bacterium]|nr:COR domain-containing protein [Chloroflexota bacterium]
MTQRSGQEWPNPDSHAEVRIQQALRNHGTELNLSNLDLTELPESLGELSSLKNLYLSANQLTELPESLGELSSLQHLDLSGNQLTELPESLGQLSSLQHLDLFDNRLTELPESLGRLSSLKNLALAVNRLTALPESLGQLSSLQHLDLSGNRLTALPESLGQLSSLQHLNLSGNRLTALPETLGRLSSLQHLDLSGNQLTALPESLGQLSSLQSLHLSHNQLTALPDFLTELTALGQLFLHANPGLKIPEDVLGATIQDVRSRRARPATPKDILSYYVRTRQASRPLNEAKLILVGRGGVGKTSLVRRLVENRFDEKQPQTKGIAITNWEMSLSARETARLNIWDFGGQEIMHATHQLFMTQRSLYLVVVSGREGNEEPDADYWLKLIERLGARSPTIVVLNKFKEVPFDLNRRALKQKYPFIKEFVETDCADGTGRDDLLQALRSETDRLEHLRDPFPASWFAIKDRLAGMKENYLSYTQYQQECTRLGEKDPSVQDGLADNLHNLGIVLSFRDSPRLRSTHVLNPHWLTNGIYQVVNSHLLEAQRGEINLAQIDAILDRTQYPPDMQAYVLDLMKRFELCFAFPDNADHYLVPELLDKQEPPEVPEFKPEQCLGFQYHYAVLPQGLLPRFIVRTHTQSAGLPRWHTGVVLAFEGCRALVKVDGADKKVHILVNGPTNARRRLLAVIRSDFEDIHASIEGLEPQAMVPLPTCPQAAIPYEKLTALENARVNEFHEVVEGTVIQVNVRDMLNGVDLEGARTRGVHPGMARSTIRLFYSYSHKDEALRDELETHLKLMQRQGLLETWHDRRIAPGDDWKGQIDDNLERADVILLLVSADFIASDYCYDVEMTRALEREAKGEVKVIPVILRDVNWRNAPFARLQALPKDGRAVTLWPDRDTAWRDVSEGIERVVKTLRSK